MREGYELGQLRVGGGRVSKVSGYTYVLHNNDATYRDRWRDYVGWCLIAGVLGEEIR